MSARAANFAINLAMVPLVLHYLGDERFGIWATVTSFAMLLAFTDLGIGNGIMTRVAHAGGDREQLARISTAGLVAASLAAVVMMVVSLGIVPLLDWRSILNVKPEAASDACAATVALGAGMALAMPANLANRIEAGFQRMWVGNLIQVTGAMAAYASTYLAIRNQSGLAVLVFCSVGVPALVAGISTGFLFLVFRPDLRPRLANLHWPEVRGLVRMSVGFLILQTTVAVAMSSDNLIISHFWGAAAVTAYALPARLFAFVYSVIQMMTGPLWPAYGDAKARGDPQWALRTLKVSVWTSLLSSVAMAALLSLFMPEVIHLWVGQSSALSGGFLLAMSLAAVLEAVRTAAVMFLNGIGVIRFQVYVDSAFALICVAAKLILVFQIGISGAPWGSVLAVLVAIAGPYAWYFSRGLHGLEASTSRAPSK